LVSSSPSCLDEDGNPVDWWAIIKAPIISGNANKAAAEGYAYSYTDSNNTLYFTSNSLATDLTASLGATLNQVYSSDSNAYMMYDDQDPTGASHSSYGHLKGVIGFDNKAGFWLVHSVPRFPLGPNSTDSYQGYPDYAATYGQSFLCVSYSLSQLNLIAGGLLLNKPYVFDQNYPFTIPSSAANITLLIQKKFITTTPASSYFKVTSLGGRIFNVFAKNAAWNKDLYSQLVQPTFGKSMDWETWMNGDLSNAMPTFCTPTYPFNSINIREVTLDVDSGIVYTETKDHSKWGINQVKSTSTTTGYLVCIGDINRQFSQAKRGGGTVCYNNLDLYTDFKAIISAADLCGA